MIAFGCEPPRSVEVGSLRNEIEKLGAEFGASALEQVRALDPDLQVEVQLVRDRPAEAIVRIADLLDAHLMVVGHRQRHLLVEVFSGSVLEGVLSETSRPVVVVQPGDD